MLIHKLILTQLLSLSFALPSLNRREVINDGNQVSNQTFDYVIAGGGIGGLVVANRLTEDENVKVLVIEAGAEGNDVRDRIDIPAQSYLNGLPVDGSPYDWNIYTTSQTNLDGRYLHWPRGKILGGSTAVNALYMTRSIKDEHDAWSNLVDDDGWNWDNLLPYFRRYETFTKPDQNMIKNLSIEIQDNAHGYDGQIQLSFPQYVYPQNSLWQPTFKNLGLESDMDPFSGTNIGGYITPNSIDPDTQLRSYAASDYLYSVQDQRPNLVVLTESLITRVLFDTSSSTPSANGLAFRPNGKEDELQVFASNEVIIAGGVLGSPQILQQSGIGPRKVLEDQQINVLVDLPGVGAHLQDHVSVSLEFKPKGDKDAVVLTGDLSNDEKETQLDNFKNRLFSQSIYSTPNQAIAYIPLRDIMGDETDSFLDELQNNITETTNAGDDPDEVKQGYRATYQSDLDNVYRANNAVVEVLLNNFGSNLGFQLAIQHPFSRGKIYINSKDPTENAEVDPLYLSHPADIKLIIEGMKYIRKLVKTDPLSTITGDEVNPGDDKTSDEDLESFVRQSLVSQYHPASSCAMLPQDLGGVVDTQLKVYGVDNLRVIDSSVIPLPIAAHHMQVVYALTEKGSDLLRGYTKAEDSPSRTDSESKANTLMDFNLKLYSFILGITTIYLM